MSCGLSSLSPRDGHALIGPAGAAAGLAPRAARLRLLWTAPPCRHGSHVQLKSAAIEFNLSRTLRYFPTNPKAKCWSHSPSFCDGSKSDISW